MSTPSPPKVAGKPLFRSRAPPSAPDNSIPSPNVNRGGARVPERDELLLREQPLQHEAPQEYEEPNDRGEEYRRGAVALEGPEDREGDELHEGVGVGHGAAEGVDGVVEGEALLLRAAVPDAPEELISGH